MLSIDSREQIGDNIKQTHDVRFKELRIERGEDGRIVKKRLRGLSDNARGRREVKYVGTYKYPLP